MCIFFSFSFCCFGDDVGWQFAKCNPIFFEIKLFLKWMRRFRFACFIKSIANGGHQGDWISFDAECTHRPRLCVWIVAILFIFLLRHGLKLSFHTPNLRTVSFFVASHRNSWLSQKGKHKLSQEISYPWVYFNLNILNNTNWFQN